MMNGAGVALLATAVGNRAHAAQQSHEHHHGKDHYDRCAEACGTCANECGSCHHHCATLATSGSKQHIATMRLCNDCQLVCSAAAALATRRGPLSVEQCKACMIACEQCATACEKFPDDKHMSLCAKRCRECAAACKAMIAAVSK